MIDSGIEDDCEYDNYDDYNKEDNKLASRLKRAWISGKKFSFKRTWTLRVWSRNPCNGIV